MDIVIISEFCEDFSETDNDRFLYLAKMLTGSYIGTKQIDLSVEIVTSSFRHTTKSQRTEQITGLPFNVKYIHEPGYHRNVCLRRFFSHFVWGKNLLRYFRRREKKPDVIYCAVPSLTGPYLVAKYCEREKIRFVIDVQDLWPEAFKMVLNLPVLSSIVFAPFYVLSNGIYKRADSICSVSDTYCQRALTVNRTIIQGTTVFLGTELVAFDNYALGKPILMKNDEEIWVAYCGTLGASYDIACVIEALSLLPNRNIRFVVMGDGPRKKEFEGLAKQRGILATFTGRIPYHQMCSLLVTCDIAVNPISHMAAQSIINKHADYAAAGIPVVNTQENCEYRSLIEKYQMGFNCNNSDAVDLSKKLIMLIKDENLRKRMGENARKCAQEKFDRAVSYHLLINQILNTGNEAEIE